LRGNLIVLASAQESIVRGQHPLGLAQAVLSAWHLIVLASPQESIARGQYPLGLAQAILVVWQSDCAHFCTRIECQRTAPPWSSTSSRCCVAI
jgi:hypothetical protein